VQTTRRRVLILAASLVLPFVVQRLYLNQFPATDFNVGPYNIHHLFTGVVLITIGGIPLAIFGGQSRWLDLAAAVFGVGLSMALDEWVYLITTDGTNASYLLPISFWGGVVMITLACGYACLLYFCGSKCRKKPE
jgi:hypothetical protein